MSSLQSFDFKTGTPKPVFKEVSLKRSVRGTEAEPRESSPLKFAGQTWPCFLQARTDRNVMIQNKRLCFHGALQHAQKRNGGNDHDPLDDENNSENRLKNYNQIRNAYQHAHTSTKMCLWAR